MGVICALRSAGEGAGEAFPGCPSGLPCETDPPRRAERTGEDGEATAIDPFRECGWLTFCELLKRRSEAADLLSQSSFATVKVREVNARGQTDVIQIFGVYFGPYQRSTANGKVFCGTQR